MKKSFMTRMLAVSLSAAMTFSLSSASSLTATEAAAKKLPANNKAVSISLKVGNSKVLKLKNYKAWNIKKGATNKKAVAAVANKGTAAKRTIKVTAKKQGTAKVTLTLGKRKTADSKTTKYSKTIKKVVTVKVKAADTTAPADTTTPTDTTPTTPTTPSTTTGSATNVTPGVLHISQASATHADTIAVSFSSIVVSTSAVKVTVTRGDSTSPIEGTWSWGVGATGGEFKTVGKLTKGTYTVTATDGKDTTTATVEVADSEEVKEIVFKGDTALTGRGTGTDDVAGRFAYVYYDLLNQYGDSVRDTYSVQWTSSANVKSIDRASGRITLEKNKGDNKEVFNYSDKIYVTGVYTKTGVTASGTFTVGSEQSVDKIKLVGLVKKGSQELLEKLPKDFKANEYQLVYNALDQNGNQMEAGDYLYESTNTNSSSRSLTFVSTNVLVIKEVLHNDGRTVTIKGNEYCAANIVPGINVNAGGTVGLSAIATKTGQKSEFNILVGDYRILKKFDIQAPTDYIIDGESVEIPFVAEDAEGNQITLFKELATQSNFSRLTFNESVGTLYLEEMDNGNARLVWSDAGTAEGAWNNSSTNDIERPVSLTSIVVGGETDNELIQVSDKARPDGIQDVNIDGVKVDGSPQNISYGDFTFVDQYGRNMKNTYEKYKNNRLPVAFAPEKDKDGEYLYDNGFFKAAARDDINFTGTDFTNYDFGINVAISGWDGAIVPVTSAGALDLGVNYVGFTYSDTNKEYISYTNTNNTFSYDKILRYQAVEPSTGKIPEVTLKCTIQKKKNTNDKEIEDVSKRYTESFKVVSLEKLSNFRIKSMDKLNIETDLSDCDNGQKLADATGNNSLDMYITNNAYTEKELKQTDGSVKAKDGTDVAVQNTKDVEVQGTYAGVDVDVPAKHIAVATNGALTTQADNAAIGNVKIAKVAAGVLKYSDLYDTSSTRFTPKDATDTIEAYVYKAGVTEANKNDILASGKTRGEEGKITTVKMTATISDSPKALTTFEAADAFTMKPYFTGITLSDLMFDRSVDSLAFASKDHKILIKDQYNNEYYKVDAWNTADDPVGFVYGWLDKDGDDKVDDGEAGYDTDFDFEYVVRDPVENKEGFVDGNFKVLNNASADAHIEGAERGDTFIVDITAKAKEVGTPKEFGIGTVGKDVDGSVVKTVKVTVGADSMCLIHDSDNFYSDTDNDLDENGQLKEASRKSVRDYLQYQLNEILGTEGYKK